MQPKQRWKRQQSFIGALSRFFGILSSLIPTALSLQSPESGDIPESHFVAL
jgi:hypothetical protein